MLQQRTRRGIWSSNCNRESTRHQLHYGRWQPATQLPMDTAAARPDCTKAALLSVSRTIRRVEVKVAKPGSALPEDNNIEQVKAADVPVTPSVEDSITMAADSPTLMSPDAAAAELDATASATTASAAPASPAAEGTPTAASVSGSSGSGGVRGGAGGGAAAAPQSTVSLMTRFNGIGYTFVLAGFLKIVTLGGLVASAPVDTARTAFGKASPYLLVPVGLGMCWVAKQVVDTGLHESRRFMQYLVATLVLMYFALTKLMYRYEANTEWVRRPRPRLPGPLADLRADLGDKDLLAGSSIGDSRSYMPEQPGRELYDDIAWYEGRYPSQKDVSDRARRGRGSGVARLDPRRAAAAASETDDEYGGLSGLNDMLRSREMSSLGSADRTQPAAAVAPTRRSFLSDNTR